jgi:hypothetical protein
LYDNPQQSQPVQQGQQMSEEERRMAEEEAYYRQGDMWYGKQNNDTALQIREALYNSVDIPNSHNSFDEWKQSRTLALTRASRVPGIDSQMFKRLVRDFEDIVDRAHSQGKRNILYSRMEKFQMKLELLVSKADLPMAGISGIGSMITQNVNQKQEIRMPQQPAPQSIFSGLTGMLPGGKR